MGKALDSTYYNRVYKDDLDKYRAYYKDSIYYDIWKQMIEFVRQIKKPEILEIGCGTGQLAHFLYDEGFKQYFGFDFSIVAVKIADDIVNMRFFVGDAYDKRIYDKFFYNVVITSEVLEHIDDDIQVLKNIKKDTHIVFSLPMFNCKGHVRYFKTPEEIKKRYKNCMAIKEITRVRNWYAGVGIIK